MSLPAVNPWKIAIKAFLDRSQSSDIEHHHYLPVNPFLMAAVHYEPEGTPGLLWTTTSGILNFEIIAPL
jgi:hypothetical protein